MTHSAFAVRLVRVLAFVFVLALALVPASAVAHPSAFGVATFELSDSETAFVYTLRIPAGAFGDLEIRPALPSGCSAEEARRVPDSGAVVLTWTGTCEPQDASSEAPIEGLGLEALPPEFSVHLVVENGENTSRHSLNAAAPSVGTTSTHTTFSYFTFGVEHIAFGYDHLLFVLGLLLLVTREKWTAKTGAGEGAQHSDVKLVMRVLGVVTAFTVGHSLSLSFAALSAPSVNMLFVEVLIAMSVVHLGREVLCPADTLTSRHPALVAASFGLVHGLGFASALSELGLPTDGRVWALLQFNLGVEFGQVVAVLIAMVCLFVFDVLYKTPAEDHTNPLSRTLGYVIGIGGTVQFLSVLVP